MEVLYGNQVKLYLVKIVRNPQCNDSNYSRSIIIYYYNCYYFLFVIIIIIININIIQYYSY